VAFGRSWARLTGNLEAATAAFWLLQFLAFGAILGAWR
jgi:hypothetical protein